MATHNRDHIDDVCREAEHDCCPICFEAVFAEPAGPVAQNALGCPRGHAICTSCARKLVRPSKTAPSGLAFRCPLCRSSAALSRLHMMVMLKGTWRDARALFDSDEDEDEWEYPCLRKDRVSAAVQCS